MVSIQIIYCLVISLLREEYMSLWQKEFLQLHSMPHISVKYCSPLRLNDRHVSRPITGDKHRTIWNRFSIVNDHKYGFINEFGKIVINPVFDSADYFSEGLAAVELNDKWGFINQKWPVRYIGKIRRSSRVF